jgi:hypothetical protein
MGRPRACPGTGHGEYAHEHTDKACTTYTRNPRHGSLSPQPSRTPGRFPMGYR